MRRTLDQLFRFGLVGAANTLLSYAVFALCLLAGLHYAAATLFGGLAGMLLGFKLTGSLVFGNRDHRRFLRFVAVFLGLYLLNVAIQRSLQGRVSPYAAGAIATVACFLLSFALNRCFVFRLEMDNRPQDYGEDYAGVQIRRSRNPLRRWVRHYYLNDILRHVQGPSVDFGCGAGDMLAMLPPGSMGLEINPAAVDYCKARDLQALRYDPEMDRFQLLDLPPGRFTTFLATHVLEHLADPAVALKLLLRACARLGIRRVILTLPCEKGFLFDRTHLTYVDAAYFEANGLYDCEGFTRTQAGYFPLNGKWLGKYYTFHEFRVVLDRRP
jgi:putative flippase GtrA